MTQAPTTVSIVLENSKIRFIPHILQKRKQREDYMSKLIGLIIAEKLLFQL